MADSIAAFAGRVGKMRAARRWTLTVMAGECGVSPSTVMRAEHGSDVTLSSAIQIAAALGVTLGQMLAEPDCPRCQDTPPGGFTCNQCGTEGRRA